MLLDWMADGLMGLKLGTDSHNLPPSYLYGIAHPSLDSQLRMTTPSTYGLRVKVVFIVACSRDHPAEMSMMHAVNGHHRSGVLSLHPARSLSTHMLKVYMR